MFDGGFADREKPGGIFDLAARRAGQGGRGQIDIGFTPEQVRVALGEPDYQSVRTTGDGTSAVWGYRDRKPRFSFGVGVGMGRGSTGVGAGVGVGPDGFRDDEKVRVAFDPSGRVSSIEVAQRR